MRFIEIIFMALLLCLMSSLVTDGLRMVKKLDSSIEKIRLEENSLRFISKSFCNVCRGKGCDDFTGWEQKCRSLWSVYEIEYGFSDKSDKNEELMFARWACPYSQGIVYCRRRNESEK